MLHSHQARSVHNGNGLLAGVVLLLIVVLGGVTVAGQTVTVPGTSGDQSVSLTYTETSYPVLTVNLWNKSLEMVRAPFPKEPTLGKGPIHRATIKVFPAESDGLHLIWDVSGRRLHIDLNRNGDLTDDTNGVYVFPAIVSESQARFAEFKNIPVTFQFEGAPHRGLFDLSLNAYSHQLNGNLSWRSSWQGKAVFSGQEYQVGLIDPISGHPTHLLLRRWDLRTSPFAVGAGNAAALPLPKALFVAGQTFGVTRKGGASPTLAFSPVASKLGEMTLSGKNISRLILPQTDNQLVAVIDDPGSTLKLPVGDYSEPEVFLKSGKSEAYREKAGYRSRFKAVTVSESQPVLFAAGGPLSNTVTAKVRGPTLAMDYQLVGADGAQYKLAAQDYQNPPRVSIRKNGKEIHSGKFAYG